jgi:hypothetical protein
MPEDRAIMVETRAGDALVVTHLAGFDEVSRGFAFTVGLAGPSLDVEPRPATRSAGSTASSPASAW